MGGKRSGSGRRAVKIDLAELERLCSIQCTDQELASFFEVDVRTIERRKKNARFTAALERGRAKGRLSVRRMLFALAAKGNVAAAIFLAKNLLGYKDYFSNEHSGPEGGPSTRNVLTEVGFKMYVSPIIRDCARSGSPILEFRILAGSRYSLRFASEM